MPNIAANEWVEVSAQTLLETIRPWSSEVPKLYVSALALVAGDRLLEAVAARTGFRTLDVTHGQIGLNGRKIYFKGVNRNEWHHDLAGAIAPEVTCADLQFIKRHNINAIRTSHYPNHSSL